jgi:transcriptional regulator with XRE-family HTH domain
MVNNKVSDVGVRLRTLRELQGLSLRVLAEKCGLSINAISLIERGENSPTVSTLQRLAAALQVSITDFFQEEAKQKVVFIKHNMGLRSQTDGTVMESLGIGLFNQQLEPFRMLVDPGVGTFNDPISHTGEEFVHCLDGEIEYLIGERIFRLAEGDSLLFDATQPHAYHNPRKTPTSLLIVFQASQDRQRVQRLHNPDPGLIEES